MVHPQNGIFMTTVCRPLASLPQNPELTVLDTWEWKLLVVFPLLHEISVSLFIVPLILTLSVTLLTFELNILYKVQANCGSSEMTHGTTTIKKGKDKKCTWDMSPVLGNIRYRTVQNLSSRQTTQGRSQLMPKTALLLSHRRRFKETGGNLYSQSDC
jgi:hypothetical protein